jgi:arsenical pump membrane protein
MCRRLAGALLIPLALLLDSAHARPAFAQAWPPFVLVGGLLLIGLVAGRDGLFDAAASRLVRLPGPPLVLLLACLALVTVVSAVLNLDTAAVFLTPVLIKTAQRRGVDVAPFLYGAIFMVNSSSLFLPGSNLTNLLVLASARVSGASFLERMLPLALAAPLLTAGGLVVIHRRGLQLRGEPVTEPPSRVRRTLGLCGVLAAAALIAALANAALAVLALGLILVAKRAHDGELAWRQSLSWLGAPTLLGLLGATTALGTLARASSFPADVLHSPGSPLTAAIAALSSVAVNNLPAAVLLSSGARLPLRALLLGLNVGPNLAVSGSLAVLLWWRAAVAAGVRPSALYYSRQGLLLAPLALAGALALSAR